MLCPCGTNKLFTNCCLAFINNKAQATTPEQLMRSRYSAYATKHCQYIYDTYAQLTQTEQSVADIQAWANECIWLGLKIHHCSNINIRFPTVEFSAYYLVANQLHKIHELSRFAIESIKQNSESQQVWRYVDGDVSENTLLANIKRNDVCPCSLFKYDSDFTEKSYCYNKGSLAKKKYKKFKNCCGK